MGTASTRYSTAGKGPNGAARSDAGLLSSGMERYKIIPVSQNIGTCVRTTLSATPGCLIAGTGDSLYRDQKGTLCGRGGQDAHSLCLAKPLQPPTGESAPDSCPTPILNSASASTRSPATPMPPGDSTCRITAAAPIIRASACCAATTTGTPGDRSPTGFLPISGCRSSPIRTTRIPSKSCPWKPSRAPVPTAPRRSGAAKTVAARGSDCAKAFPTNRVSSRFYEMRWPLTSWHRRRSTSGRRPGNCGSGETAGTTGVACLIRCRRSTGSKSRLFEARSSPAHTLARVSGMEKR